MEEQEDRYDPASHLEEGGREGGGEEEEEEGLKHVNSHQNASLTKVKGQGAPHIDTSVVLDVTEVGGALGGTSRNLLCVHEAFAGDDVIGQFAAEKEEEREKDRPKKVTLSLPGTYMYAYIHITYTYIHTCIYTYLYTDIHTYVHTYTVYAYIHTYTHTCTLWRIVPLWFMAYYIALLSKGLHTLGNICCCNVVAVTLRNMLLNVASNFFETFVANHL